MQLKLVINKNHLQPKGSMCQTCCGSSGTLATPHFAFHAVKCSAYSADWQSAAEALNEAGTAPAELLEGAGILCGH